MIRIRHLSGSQQGKSQSWDQKVIRIGRAADCDLHFEQGKEPKVSNHHAEIVKQGAGWVVVDTSSTNGTLVNGRRVQKHTLRPGDRVQVGSGGPVIQVQFEAPSDTLVEMPAIATMAVKLDQVEKSFSNTTEMTAIKQDLKVSADTQTAKLAEIAAQKVALERAKSGGKSSGQTMMIMADTLRQVQQSTKTTTKKRWVKVVAIVAGVAVVVTSAMGVVIWQQKKQIEKLVQQKDSLDKEIVAIQNAMESEEDEARLAELEEKLKQLTARAEQTIQQVGAKNKDKAAELADSGDELDREIRRILQAFDANAYAVPPLFKERLQHHIDVLRKSSNLGFIYRRKQRYWPTILQEFKRYGLPEEMAFIAWAETQFDPKAKSSVGAAGMWQFMPATARNFHLRVDDKVDERHDPEKSTRAAARYLANLLAEFGSDSFMLAMASYNRGESGVRRVLRQIAEEEGGFRKDKREFWHLYRLKKLPEETREYVPKVLAAAIVCRNPKKYGLEQAAELAQAED
jgi:soluble lytic murein transglycosylase-like protein/pSer/pThr/pTyr-binding forkhead associated (FHA) protein